MNYPETIQVRVPAGTSAALAEVADLEGVKPSEFIRIALGEATSMRERLRAAAVVQRVPVGEIVRRALQGVIETAEREVAASAAQPMETAMDAESRLNWLREYALPPAELARIFEDEIGLLRVKHRASQNRR
jgi:hypothetical protein